MREVQELERTLLSRLASSERRALHEHADGDHAEHKSRLYVLPTARVEKRFKESRDVEKAGPEDSLQEHCTHVRDDTRGDGLALGVGEHSPRLLG